MLRTNVWIPWGKPGGVEHGELYLVLCGDLNGKETQNRGRGDI